MRGLGCVAPLGDVLRMRVKRSSVVAFAFFLPWVSLLYGSGALRAAVAVDSLQARGVDSGLVAQRTRDSLRAEGDSSWYGGRLGLVLSGGGALGLAHIGLLRVLDELGIRPDYITGTSMGAVIGGLYAMGYSGEQISQLNREASWSELLNRTIDMRKVMFDQKASFSRSVFSMELRNKRMQMKYGYIEGQNLWDFFLRLTWPVVGLRHFDSSGAAPGR